MKQKLLSLLTLLLCVSSGAWATDITVSPMFNDGNSTIDAGIFTITAGTNVSYSSKSYQIGKKKTGTITVTSTKSGCYIKSITFTDTNSKINSVATSTEGATASLSSYTATISANENEQLSEIVFTATESNNSGTIKITAMTIVVDNQSGDDIEAMYAFTGKTDGVITCTHSPSTSITLGGNASNNSSRVSWGNNKTFTISSATKYLKAIYWQFYNANTIAGDKMTTTTGTYSYSSTNRTGSWTPESSTQSVTFTQASGSTSYLCHVIAVMKTISSQAMSGIKVGGSALTKDAATNGYTVSGTTLTLTNDQAVIAAPTNITLTNNVVFSDASEDNLDVAVEFSETPTDGYFIGTATIDETEYTVKVPVNTNPALELSETSGTVTLKSYENIKVNYGSTPTLAPVTITLTGSNLTDGTYDVSAEGLTISPTSFTVADGSVSQVFQILTTASTAASTDINFTVGDKTVTYTLNVTKPAKRSLSRTSISEATTWDWKYATSTTASDTDDILLTKIGSDKYTTDTDPARDEEFVLATLPEITNGATFDSQALLVTGQYMRRYIGPEFAFQGSKIIFTTTVPGTVTVYFASTSNSKTRKIYINGTDTGASDMTGHPTVEASATVPAGDVTIEGYEDTTPNLVRIAKIVFTPATATVTTNAGKWASFTPSWNATLADGATAYIITNVTETSVTASAVDVLKTGEGYFVKGESASTPYTATASADETTATTGNLIVGCTSETAINASTPDGNTKYVLGTTAGGDSGLFKVDSDVTVAAGKAYLNAGSVINARQLSLDFEEGGTTGITSVKEQKSLLDGDFYNVAGQRVNQPTKGLYIVNGRKVIVK